VISFFPSGILQYQADGFVDLYTSILSGWTRCDSAWDLYALLVKEATSFMFRQDNMLFTNLVETYRWAIETKAATQTDQFEAYSQSHTAGDVDASALDDRRELTLALDLADIIDELNIIRYLAETQREVIKSLALVLRQFQPTLGSGHGKQGISFEGNNITICGGQPIFQLQNTGGIEVDPNFTKTIVQGIEGLAGNAVLSADETLEFLLADIETMRKDAEYARKMVKYLPTSISVLNKSKEKKLHTDILLQLLSLLDLKQKAASLAEARSTTQQGRVIMLFTIVTIIFVS
jgi:hypothetical protein